MATAADAKRQPSDQLVFFSYKSRHLGTPGTMKVMGGSSSSPETPGRARRRSGSSAASKTPGDARVRNVSVVSTIGGVSEMWQSFDSSGGELDFY
jgi:hypothetical protein